VIVISDGTLKAAGLGYDEAIGLLKPADGELVVHIREELDDIPLPGIRSLKPEDDFGGDTIRPTDRASAEWPWPVPTIPPTNAKASVFKAALPATEAEIDADRLERRLAAVTPSPSPLDVLGLRLPERGLLFYQLEYVARALGVQATLLPGGGVHLDGIWGAADYGSVHAAAAALNARAFRPEEL
jgi:hypothetical protein